MAVQRLPGLHAELEVSPAGGRVYLGQPTGEFRNAAEVGTTSHVYVIVDAVDEHHERAKAAGARVTEEPNDLTVRRASLRVRRPLGHEWVFAQVLGTRG